MGWLKTARYIFSARTMSRIFLPPLAPAPIHVTNFVTATPTIQRDRLARPSIPLPPPYRYSPLAPLYQHCPSIPPG